MKKRLTYFAFMCLLLTTILSGTLFASGTLYVLADFENPYFPPANWSVANTSQYNWIWTSYCSGYGSGSSCITADFYDYAAGNFDLLTKTFPPSTAGDQLIFDHAYATSVPAYNDRLDVYTSTDGGSTWALLISLLGGSSGPLVTAPATADLFVPSAGQWATKTYSLPNGTNKIKFQGVTAFGNNLYLDNIKIGTTYGNDVGVNAIKNPKWGITPQSLAPQATVRNFGTSTQSFNVTMTINPGGYTNTQSVSNLAAGQTATVNFGSFNFSTLGNYTLRAYSSLGTDQNVSNDTITNNLIVTNTQRNVVLEFCTGTWCQWCPCGDDEAHHLSVTYPNSVILAYHGSSTDPWKVFNGNNIIGLLLTGPSGVGYPSGLVDRRLGVNNGWGSMFTDAENRMMNSPAGAVNIVVNSQTYNTGTRVLTVNATATALSTLSGQYKVNYVVKEGNLVWAQTGNSYCPGNSSAVHNWVVRNMVNNAAGENVNSGTWNSGQSYPLTFTTTLDPAWVAGNCSFDVFVYKDNGSLNVSETQQGVTTGITVTGISNEGNEVPNSYSLSQNYPNPFNPVTNVHFSIPKDGQASFKLYNVMGQLIETTFEGNIKAGNYNAEIDASKWASGVYFYTLSSGDFVQTKKMILTK